MARLDTSVDAWVDRLEEGEGDEFSATFRIRTRLPATWRFPVTNGTVRVTYHKTLVQPATGLSKDVRTSPPQVVEQSVEAFGRPCAQPTHPPSPRRSVYQYQRDEAVRLVDEESEQCMAPPMAT
jgi:hypothetical protein